MIQNSVRITFNRHRAKGTAVKRRQTKTEADREADTGKTPSSWRRRTSGVRSVQNAKILISQLSDRQSTGELDGTEGDLLPLGRSDLLGENVRRLQRDVRRRSVLRVRWFLCGLKSACLKLVSCYVAHLVDYSDNF